MAIYKKIKNVIEDECSLSLIIFPTLECNFRCQYCYENKELGFMSQTTIENIYSAVVQHYETVKFKFFKLEWFGGEPLLFYNNLLELTIRLNEFCKLHDIAY